MLGQAQTVAALWPPWLRRAGEYFGILVVCACAVGMTVRRGFTPSTLPSEHHSNRLSNSVYSVSHYVAAHATIHYLRSLMYAWGHHSFTHQSTGGWGNHKLLCTYDMGHYSG